MADTALNPAHTISDILARPLQLYRGLKGDALAKAIAGRLSMAGPGLQLTNLREEIRRKDQEPFTIFKDGSLSLRDGECVSVVGPSGCGKTTLLRVINGLLPRTSGEIYIDGKSAAELDHELVMGFVFQGASLLPWRTSLKNVLLGLEGRGANAAEAENIARKFLDLVGLSGFENHYPHELSGGMQQRVNLARALAVNPRILLMDEPFAALDAQTRNFMQLELLRIWRETRKTVIFVTHMIAEAILLSDRVIVFSHRPGTIRSEFQVPLERPRTMEMRADPRFLELENILWKQIEAEVNASGGFAQM